MDFFKTITRNRFLLIYDVIFIIISYAFTNLIIFRDEFFWQESVLNFEACIIAIVAFIGFMFISGCYHIYWVYASTREYSKIVFVCFCAVMAASFAVAVLGVGNYFFKAELLFTIISAVVLTGFRMGLRAIGKFIRFYRKRKHGMSKDVLIVGAGVLGVTIAKDIQSSNDYNYNILGFIDSDPRKQNSVIAGVKVLGSLDDLPKICDRYKPAEIIIAIANADVENKKRIISTCVESGVKVKIMPGLAYAMTDKNSVKYIRDVEVEDLLARDEVHLDNDGISKYIEDKVVMVTGGAGSIGSELCRQIIKFSPKKLVVVDIYENSLFDLENHLREDYSDRDMEFVITSVRDKARLEQIFDIYKPQIVFHAAAHKHVPLMEISAVEAVKNNVFGTYNVACCADKFKVKRFVMISTDKAVNPTNVMGATKRVCEMIIQAMQSVSKTEFVAVRFGNVLNSNGSVLPRFKEQIKKGGPITVTHPEITRFFMTIPEAAQLVLQAGAYAKGGEIFVLDMGEPVKIREMAENLIRLSGFKVGEDIKIEYVGLRPGEKLYEELLMDEEGLQKTRHNKIHVAKPFFDSYDELLDKLKILSDAAEIGTNKAIKDAISQVVPTYVRKTEEEQEKENKLTV